MLPVGCAEAMKGLLWMCADRKLAKLFGTPLLNRDAIPHVDRGPLQCSKASQLLEKINDAKTLAVSHPQSCSGVPCCD